MTIRTRRKRSISGHSVAGAEVPAIVRLWMLRCLVPLHGYRRLVQREFIDDGVARAVGLKGWVDKQGDEFDRGRLISELRGLHREIERVAEDCHLPETLGRNIRQLARLIGLDETEQVILAFVVMLHSDKNLKTAVGYLGEQPLQQLYANLATILYLPEIHVRNAFSGRSRCHGPAW
jgi:hypothetical protein